MEGITMKKHKVEIDLFKKFICKVDNLEYFILGKPYKAMLKTSANVAIQNEKGQWEVFSRYVDNENFVGKYFESI
jgi:hypothetical protein